MRAAEAGCGVALDVLMDRAGAALADAVWRFGNGAETLILCGPGNNGGDGFVAARMLAERSVKVRVAASAPPRTALAQAAAARWTGLVEPLAEAGGAPVLLDALFGYGLTRALDAGVARPLHRLAGGAHVVIAADVPSGIRCDDGSDLGAAAATVTIALGAAKPAHLLQPAASLCGTVLVADIGIGCESDTTVLERPALTPPGPSDHKYTRGMVAVVGGVMPGAGALATISAARGGAGYVVAVGVAADLPHATVRRADLSSVLCDVRVGAVVVGPGLGHDARAATLLNEAIRSDRALVIDGDGLTSAALTKRSAPTILTPHGGEFDRLFGSLPGSKIDRARTASAATGATIIYKGADTVIASPDGRVSIATTAPAWLSTAGTGDVLAGLAGAMLARGLGTHEAACAAVWLHGEAARRAGHAFIADDLPDQFAALL